VSFLSLWDSLRPPRTMPLACVRASELSSSIYSETSLPTHTSPSASLSRRALCLLWHPHVPFAHQGWGQKQRRTEPWGNSTSSECLLERWRGRGRGRLQLGGAARRRAWRQDVDDRQERRQDETRLELSACTVSAGSLSLSLSLSFPPPITTDACEGTPWQRVQIIDGRCPSWQKQTSGVAVKPTGTAYATSRDLGLRSLRPPVPTSPSVPTYIDAWGPQGYENMCVYVQASAHITCHLATQHCQPAGKRTCVARG
jgi:hypothetical protein